MSKTETWRNAALTATEKERAAVRSTAEAQHRLAEQITLIAESMKLLSIENRQTTQALRQQLEETVTQLGNVMKQRQDKKGPAGWMTAAALGGVMLGMLLLSVLAILRPTLLTAAWSAAVTLGTAP